MPSIESWWAGEIDWSTPAGQHAVDLFRPAFDDDSPNRYPENTHRLWREVFHGEIDVRREIIEPAITRRRQGYGEPPLDYKGALKT
jgi:hypothetical protein